MQVILKEVVRFEQILSDDNGVDFTVKDDIPRKQKVKFKPSSSKKTDKSWIIKTIVITFTMSAVFSFLSQGVMNKVSIWIAVLILLAIIFVGILFDIVGMAVTAADEAPFHSMAVQRVKHAKRAIALIKSKEKVSNFCNDVIGDICGIVSGSASAAVVAYVITMNPNLSSVLMSLVITAAVAALTVGGKAVGKSIAMKYSNYIIYNAARVLSLVVKPPHILRSEFITRYVSSSGVACCSVMPVTITY